MGSVHGPLSPEKINLPVFLTCQAVLPCVQAFSRVVRSRSTHRVRYDQVQLHQRDEQEFATCSESKRTQGRLVQEVRQRTTQLFETHDKLSVA